MDCQILLQKQVLPLLQKCKKMENAKMYFTISSVCDRSVHLFCLKTQ